MDTAPLPPIGHSRGDGDGGGGASGDGDDPTRPIQPVPSVATEAGSARIPAGLRALEVIAGLLSGGLLLVGLALLALQVLAPELAPGTGLATPSGPTWWRVAAHLGVGVAGELTVLARWRSSRGWRYLLAAAVILAVLAVLWLAWWA